MKKIIIEFEVSEYEFNVLEQSLERNDVNLDDEVEEFVRSRFGLYGDNSDD